MILRGQKAQLFLVRCFRVERGRSFLAENRQPLAGMPFLAPKW